MLVEETMNAKGTRTTTLQRSWHLLNHMVESVEEGEETTIPSLSERVAETQEDTEERQAISQKYRPLKMRNYHRF